MPQAIDDATGKAISHLFELRARPERSDILAGVVQGHIKRVKDSKDRKILKDALEDLVDCGGDKSAIKAWERRFTKVMDKRGWKP